jgi:hypothetical protein
MSIATASRFAVEAETGTARTTEPTDPAAAKLSTAVQQLTAYIPAEGLGIYIALIGLFQASTRGAQWALFAVGLAAVALFVWLTYQPLDRATETRTRNFLWLNVFALGSFTAYTAALPGTPFLQFGDQATRVAAAAAIILAPTIPALAKRLGLRLQSQK